MAAMAAVKAPAAGAAPARPRPASSAMSWMTRFRSSLGFLALLPVVSGCAVSSGQPATAIAQPEIAAAYLPLHGRVHLGLDSANGAAVGDAPGIRLTHAPNAQLLEAKS